MLELLHLELVTPEKSIFVDEVRMVVAPAAEGDIGILPRHATIMAMLRAGMIEVHDANGDVSKYYTDGGYVSMINNTCIILAEALVVESALSKELLQANIAELKQKIAHEKCDDLKIFELQRRIIEAENALLLVN
jgi:F-type H+-transporting ATPase subunit epsilon